MIHSSIVTLPLFFQSEAKHHLSCLLRRSARLPRTIWGTFWIFQLANVAPVSNRSNFNEVIEGIYTREGSSVLPVAQANQSPDQRSHPSLVRQHRDSPGLRLHFLRLIIVPPLPAVCRDPRGPTEAIKNKISSVIKLSGMCGAAYIFNVPLNTIRQLVGVLFLFVHILASSGSEISPIC